MSRLLFLSKPGCRVSWSSSSYSCDERLSLRDFRYSGIFFLISFLLLHLEILQFAVSHPPLRYRLIAPRRWNYLSLIGLSPLSLCAFSNDPPFLTRFFLLHHCYAPLSLRNSFLPPPFRSSDDPPPFLSCFPLPEAPHRTSTPLLPSAPETLPEPPNRYDILCMAGPSFCSPLMTKNSRRGPLCSPESDPFCSRHYLSPITYESYFS